MKYVLIWMISLGVAIGLASDRELELASQNPVAVIVFAPVMAAAEIFERID